MVTVDASARHDCQVVTGMGYVNRQYAVGSDTIMEYTKLRAAHRCRVLAAVITAVLTILVAGVPAYAALRQHTVAVGETLSGIALNELGNATRWPEIAQLNNITDPGRLPGGSTLRLPIADRDTPPTAIVHAERAVGTAPTGQVIVVTDSGIADGIAERERRLATVTTVSNTDSWSAVEYELSDPALERLVERAFISSPALARAQASVRSGAARVRQAQSAFYPTLGASERFVTSDNPAQGLMFTVEQGTMRPQEMANITVPTDRDDWTTAIYMRALVLDFGGRSGMLDAAYADARRQEWLLQATRRDIRYAVARTYYDELNARAAVQLWAETVRLYEEHERLTKTNYAAGTVLRSDLLIIQVRLSDARENLTAANNRVADAHCRLAAAVGVPGSEIAAVVHPVTIPSYSATEDSLVAAIRGAHPLLSALDEAEQAAEAMARAARGSGLPTLALQAEMDWHGDDENPGFDRKFHTIAVVADVPIFDGWRTTAAGEEARARADEAAAARHETATALEVAARSAHRQMTEAVARITIADDAVQAARTALTIVEDRYRAGFARTLDLIEIERNLTEARLRALNARSAAWTAQATIELVSGK